MSDALWTTGRIETEHGLCAWPAMKRRDAERLPPVRTQYGVFAYLFEAGNLTIDGILFGVRVRAPREGEFGRCRVLLHLRPDIVMVRPGAVWGQREEALILDLFQKHLGSATPRHWRPWGEIRLAHDDKSSGEPFIWLIYRSKLSGWMRFAWHVLTGR